ncbi:MAG: hypothetical protein UW43_C0002G0067 [Candidatus Yanofskybacteria bacterium GW2011_GWA1_44_21]|uniref:Uncharacterized protein n=2 Tax=Parcubacteria group TaxID=1794811 RepID=A0A1F8H2P2_9BACT|nr:MAG: hypothetical protein UU38_C0004G0023 [Candidatus Wolfebacteria bacterium GW2011_GWB1_41_12]KKT28913.1 MAG: hypothetical protein UW14_C0001G0024 [Candidatus Yanofskybacteria bacterium GW2011_GWA2_44_10]KKT50783.1 MAG: hypothetical protein UW43_C0002G0067 [Candidatus Yanofskybacteria bacterium GW2011_GWA1_44_21]OGN02888.1 MAG: hypothetical protein A2657_02730 [Candidatus Yanofskybacteria bacterium RIFCSPHIGHO2_01_FULL_44_110b]OGN14143.1 MAG: hypothetical protein A3C01_00920 [Candidatus Ya
MRNFLTMEVESWVGSVFVIGLALFFVGLIFITMRNFNSDISIMNSTQAKVKGISATESVLIRDWVKQNDIKIPDGKGYRYVISKYPARPWLTQ